MNLSARLPLACAAALLCGTAFAADWSDNSVGYRYASHQSEPGVSDKVAKDIFTFTHVSGDHLGTNFFYANGGTNGAQELYGFYQRSFSLNALTDHKGNWGFAKDLSLVGRFDFGTKNTTFAPRPRKLRVGISASMPVQAGFWDIGVQAYRESMPGATPGEIYSAIQTDWYWRIPAVGFADAHAADVVRPIRCSDRHRRRARGLRRRRVVA